jgi:hypothetical protein
VASPNCPLTPHKTGEQYPTFPRITSYLAVISGETEQSKHNPGLDRKKNLGFFSVARPLNVKMALQNREQGSKWAICGDFQATLDRASPLFFRLFLPFGVGLGAFS